MTFQLDTCGGVCAPIINGWAKWPHQALSCGEALRWDDLSPFAQGYIEALFADFVSGLLTQTVGFDHPHIVAFGERVRGLAFSDLAPETLARIIADCEAMERNKGKPGTRENGADCWAGRQEGRKPGDYAPHPFPPLTVQLCDDGKVRFA